MRKGSPGFNRVTKTHVEGQTAASMRILGINRGTLLYQQSENLRELREASAANACSWHHSQGRAAEWSS
jgi:hypothetical protein